jgi:Cellobiose phosphorylase
MAGMGCLNAGMTEEGYAILADLLPANHDESIYRAEPYVIAADVYSNEQQTGRGGWSWYTGSSGWYLKVVSENLLGLRVRDGLLYIEPNLPKSWNGYTVRWSTENGDYDIEVRNREKYEILVGGEKWDGTGLPLSGKAWANTLHNLTGFDS